MVMLQESLLIFLGNTLLHDAMSKCSSEFVLDLINRELCDVDTRNKSGETPLIMAAAAGKLDVMQKLIALGIVATICNSCW